MLRISSPGGKHDTNQANISHKPNKHSHANQTSHKNQTNISPQGAEVTVTCRKSSPELDAFKGVQVITDVDVTDAASVEAMALKVDKPLDILINNAGYFYEPLEVKRGGAG